MIKSIRRGVWVIFCLTALGAALPAAAEKADVVLYNGKLLTVDERFSIQTAPGD